MYRSCGFLVLFLLGLCLSAQTFEKKYLNNETYSHEELMRAYEWLYDSYPGTKLEVYGKSDGGHPLHAFIIGGGEAARANPDEYLTIMVMNGIHPGESDGIDACLHWCEDILKNKWPLNTVLVILPVYNVDGMLNRGVSRANQNGPEEHGFRGNARNLDLNRDFIKMDSENSRSFAHLFRSFDPDIFIDTHTSNGADYQYMMTLITSQEDKMDKPLAEYVYGSLEPELYKRMAKRGFEMVPYVNTLGETPESGIVAFMETPRYSTGFTNLFQTISFVTETHMFKPYPQRVEATRAFLEEIFSLAIRDWVKIEAARLAARNALMLQNELALNWKLDTTQARSWLFKGFEATYETSQVTGLPRLKYHRDKPFEKKISFFNHYTPTDFTAVPQAYILPQAWREVAYLLQNAGVELIPLLRDTLIEGMWYYLESVSVTERMYEGRYPHRSYSLKEEKGIGQFYKGDFLVMTNDPTTRRFIFETLEPVGVDSYFRWNFFDPILGQKEWFSDYVFEEDALKMLENDPALKEEYEQWKSDNPEAAKNAWQSLGFIYRRSPLYESTHNRYPVMRVF